MIRIKDHNQREMFDPWAFLSPKRRKMLDNSWAGLFLKEILPELPVKAIMPYFDSSFGRPTKELYTVLGVHVLQQTFDLTDQETINQFAYNIQWHYALNITEESDSAKYLSAKTLWNTRYLIAENELEALAFNAITDKLSKIYNVNLSTQRIDSVHIKSNMRRLGRICIFTETIHKFLVNLKRGHLAHFDTIEKRIVDKYFSEKALGCFSMVKPSAAQKTLTDVSKDLYELVEQFKTQPEVTSMHSYKLMQRVLNEQCNLTPSDTKEPVKVKKPKEIASDSLQNPSDPDATYSGHKGQGYQVQVMETFCDDEEAKENTLNLITEVHVEPAHNSDANALIPAIESTKERGLMPEELLADSLYGSDDNSEYANKEGVDLVAPTMGTAKDDKLSLSDFEVSESGKIIACPNGNSPVRTRQKNNRVSVAFDSAQCKDCPNRESCPVKDGKKFRYLRYTDKEMRIAKRRAYEQTVQFKDRYRWRAGVEATMSEYDRKTGVKRLRVRGLKAVRFSATLKAAGVNIMRAAAVRMAGLAPKQVAYGV
jgi:hypothetical protein